MSIRVNITITGDKKALKQLKKLKIDLLDWSKELKTMGVYLKKYWSGAVFTSEGSVLGNPWRKLSPQYELSKRKLYPAAGILVRTGDLKDGFEYNAGRNEMKIYNKVPYASYHLYGTRRMVAREFMGVNTPIKNELGKIFKDGLYSKIRKAL